MKNHPEFFEKLYSQRFTALENYRDNVWKIICSEFLFQYVPAGSTVLDIGAGWGEFINNVIATNKIAMDLNPATEKHLLPGITFLHQDCSKQWEIESDSVDVVFTSNFIEHLSDKLSIERTLAEACRCLKNGGKIVCMGPNIKYTHGAYWDFWDHHIPITDLSCAELLKMHGFSVERSIPRFLPYSMSTGNKPPLFMVKLYLRIPILWRLFGKQFLIVGRKSDGIGDNS